MSAPVHIRSTTLATTFGVATLNVSFGSLPAVGNQIIARVFGSTNGAAATSVTLSDNQGGSNTYAQSVFVNNATGNRYCAIAASTIPLVTSSGTFTLTITINGGSGNNTIELAGSEYGTMATGNPLNVTISNTGASTVTLDTTAAASTSQADEVFFSVCATNSGSASTAPFTNNAAGSVPSSGWTNDFSDGDDTNLCAGVMSSVIVSSIQAPRDVITANAAGPFSAVLASFKGATTAETPTTITGLGRRMISVGYWQG